MPERIRSSEVAVGEYIHSLDATVVGAILRRFGYDICINGRLRGASGEAHQFDFVCKGNGERIVINGIELYDDYSNELEMIKVRVKTLDSCPDLSVVIFHQTCPEGLRKMALEFHYVLVEPTNSRNVYEQLEEYFRSRVS